MKSELTIEKIKRVTPKRSYDEWVVSKRFTTKDREHNIKFRLNYWEVQELARQLGLIVMELKADETKNKRQILS